MTLLMVLSWLFAKSHRGITIKYLPLVLLT